MLALARKKEANLQLSLHVQKLSVSASGGKAPWPPHQGLCHWTHYIISMHITTEKKSTFGPHKKNYCPPVPWSNCANVPI